MVRTKKVFKERQYSERDIGEMGEYGTTAKCTTEYMKNQQKIVVVFSTFFLLGKLFPSVVSLEIGTKEERTFLHN